MLKNQFVMSKFKVTTDVLGKWRPIWTPSWIYENALWSVSRAFNMLFYSYFWR